MLCHPILSILLAGCVQRTRNLPWWTMRTGVVKWRPQRLCPTVEPWCARTTSPTTMPRTPPSGFVKAVILPNLIILTTDWAPRPWPISRQIGKNTCITRMSLHTGRKCSVDTPEGPPAAPHRQGLNTRQNLCSSNSNGRTGACLTTSSGNGSRSVRGLLAWSFNWFKVAVFQPVLRLPKPDAPKTTPPCGTTSPLWLLGSPNHRALPSPRNCRLLVALLTGHDQPNPITFDETLKTLEQLGLSLCNIIRGNMKNNFHPLPWSTSSSLLVISSNAISIPFLNMPTKNFGIDCMTDALCWIWVQGSTSSRLANARLRHPCRGNGISASSSTNKYL